MGAGSRAHTFSVCFCTSNMAPNISWRQFSFAWVRVRVRGVRVRVVCRTTLDKCWQALVQSISHVSEAADFDRFSKISTWIAGTKVFSWSAKCCRAESPRRCTSLSGSLRSSTIVRFPGSSLF